MQRYKIFHNKSTKVFHSPLMAFNYRLFQQHFTQKATELLLKKTDIREKKRTFVH